MTDCWTWAQMMEICCFDLEIRVIMLPRNIKHADRHNFESHRSKSRRVWPCSASPWSQISLAKILGFEEPNSQLYFAAPLTVGRSFFLTSLIEISLNPSLVPLPSVRLSASATAVNSFCLSEGSRTTSSILAGGRGPHPSSRSPPGILSIS